MTIPEIEQAILDTVKKVYCKEYIGTLRIERLQPQGLSVRLGMNVDDKPIYIAAQCDDETFIKYFEQELLDRDWDTIHFYLGTRTMPDTCPVNPKCGCHDR